MSAFARRSTARSSEGTTRPSSAMPTRRRTRRRGARRPRTRSSRTRTSTGATTRRPGGRPGRWRPRTSTSTARPEDGLVVDRRRRGVLLVSDVVAPRCGVAVLVDLEHRDVRHEPCWRGAVPVLLARIEEDAVAWANHLDWPAAPLRAPDAFEDVD